MTTSWFPIFAVATGLLGFLAGRRLRPRPASRRGTN